MLYTFDGVPKITDFGLAKRIDSDDGNTESGQVMVSPSYMAPEKARGHSRTSVYPCRRAARLGRRSPCSSGLSAILMTRRLGASFLRSTSRGFIAVALPGDCRIRTRMTSARTFWSSFLPCSPSFSMTRPAAFRAWLKKITAAPAEGQALAPAVALVVDPVGPLVVHPAAPE